MLRAIMEIRARPTSLPAMPRRAIWVISSRMRWECMDPPCVARENREAGVFGLAPMYQASFWSSCSGPSWKSARVRPHYRPCLEGLFGSSVLGCAGNVWTRRVLQEKIVKLGCLVLHQCIRPRFGAHAPGHHGNPRASDLITGHASKGYLGHQFSDALG